ncbi:MAG: ABC transporter substrate-binding protein [Chloroflexi bacterium]|nr:ABC transporter substrate-binding protein [Chloroflexota bacterium]
MNHRWMKAVVSCSLGLALLATLCLGCGTKEEGNKGKVIVIGSINDLSGPASSALKLVEWNLIDYVRYVNEKDPIPGVTLDVASYDCKYDPARYLSGYEWVKSKGAEVISCPITGTAETLKSYAAEDHKVIWVSSPSLVTAEPAGWVFSSCPLIGMNVKTLLGWVSQQPEYSSTKIKIASVACQDPAQLERVRGLKEYIAAHPDRYELVANVISPQNTMTWSGELTAVKNADIVCLAVVGPAAATFIAEFRAKGYSQRIISTDMTWGFQKLIEDKVGDKQLLDGSWMTTPFGWWTDGYPLWEQAKQMLQEYRPSDADSIMQWGASYPADWYSVMIVDIIRKAVAEVGPENFNGQAFYDTALTWSMTAEGYNQWTFADGKRYAIRDVMAYEYEYKSGSWTMVPVSGWLPIVQ